MDIKKTLENLLLLLLLFSKKTYTLRMNKIKRRRDEDVKNVQKRKTNEPIYKFK